MTKWWQKRQAPPSVLPWVAVLLIALLQSGEGARQEKAGPRREHISVVVNPDGTFTEEKRSMETEGLPVFKAKSWKHAEMMFEHHVMNSARDAGIPEHQAQSMFPESHQQHHVDPIEDMSDAAEIYDSVVELARHENEERQKHFEPSPARQQAAMHHLTQVSELLDQANAELLEAKRELHGVDETSGTDLCASPGVEPSRVDGTEGFVDITPSTSIEEARRTWDANYAIFAKSSASRNGGETWSRKDLMYLKPAFSLSVGIIFEIPVNPMVSITLSLNGQITYNALTKCWAWTLGGNIGVQWGIDILGYVVSINFNLKYMLNLEEKPWTDVRKDWKTSPHEDLKRLERLMFRAKGANDDVCQSSPFRLLINYFSSTERLSDFKNAAAEGQDEGVTFDDKLKGAAKQPEYARKIFEFMLYYRRFLEHSMNHFERFDPCPRCSAGDCGKGLGMCSFCKLGETQGRTECMTVPILAWHEPSEKITHQYLEQHYLDQDGGSFGSRPINVRASGETSPDRANLDLWTSALLGKAALRFYKPLVSMIKSIPPYADQIMEMLVDTHDQTTPDEEKAFHGNFLADWFELPDSTSEARDGHMTNPARIMRLSDQINDPQFWKHTAMSIGNIFVRVVADIKAMFDHAFADKTVWDGQCASLPDRLLDRTWAERINALRGEGKYMFAHKIGTAHDAWATKEQDSSRDWYSMVLRGVPYWTEPGDEVPAPSTKTQFCCCENVTGGVKKANTELYLGCRGEKKGTWPNAIKEKTFMWHVFGGYFCCKTVAQECAKTQAHGLTVSADMCAGESWQERFVKTKAKLDLPDTAPYPFPGMHGIDAPYRDVEKMMYPHLWCGLAQYAPNRSVSFGDPGSVQSPPSEYQRMVEKLANAQEDVLVEVRQSCVAVEFQENSLTEGDQIEWDEEQQRYGVSRKGCQDKKMKSIRHGWLKMAKQGHTPGEYVPRSESAEPLDWKAAKSRGYVVVSRRLSEKYECKKTTLPRPFVRLFPTFAAMVLKYRRKLERIMLNLNICLGEILDVENLEGAELPDGFADFVERTERTSRGCISADGHVLDAPTLAYVKSQSIQMLRTVRKFLYLLGAQTPLFKAQTDTDPDPEEIDMGLALGKDAKFALIKFGPLANSMAQDFNDVLGIEPSMVFMAENNFLIFKNGTLVRRQFSFKHHEYELDKGIILQPDEYHLSGSFWRDFNQAPPGTDTVPMSRRLLEIAEAIVGQMSGILPAVAADDAKAMSVPMKWSHAFTASLRAGTAGSNIQIACEGTFTYKSWMIGQHYDEICCGGSFKYQTTVDAKWCKASDRDPDDSVVGRTSSRKTSVSTPILFGSIVDTSKKKDELEKLGSSLLTAYNSIKENFKSVADVAESFRSFALSGTDSAIILRIVDHLNPKMLQWSGGAATQNLVDVMMTSMTNATKAITDPAAVKNMLSRFGEYLKETSFITGKAEYLEGQAKALATTSESFKYDISINIAQVEKDIELRPRPGQSFYRTETSVGVGLTVKFTYQGNVGFGATTGKLTIDLSALISFDFSPLTVKWGQVRMYEQWRVIVEACQTCLKQEKGFCNLEPMRGFKQVGKLTACTELSAAPGSHIEAFANCVQPGIEVHEKHKFYSANGEKLMTIPEWFSFPKPAKADLDPPSYEGIRAAFDDNWMMDCTRMTFPRFDLGYVLA